MDSQNGARAREGREGEERERKGTENQQSLAPGEVCYRNTPLLAGGRRQGSCWSHPPGPRRKTGKGYKQAIHGEAMQMADNHERVLGLNRSQRNDNQSSNGL